MVAILQATILNAFYWLKRLHFHQNLTEVCSLGFIWEKFNIGLGNTLMLNTQRPLTQSIET